MSAPSVTAFRGTPPSPAQLPSPAPGSEPQSVTARGPRDPGGQDRLLHPLGARAMSFVLLTIFGGLHWMRMLEPPVEFRAWYAVGAAVITGAGLVAGAQLPWRAARAAVTAVSLAAGTALALLAAGVADELLAPAHWDELAGGIARGIDALRGARVPYRGLDDWLRLAITLGGTALPVLAAALAFWPRRGGRTGFPIAAVVALVTLYAVPAVSLIFDAEFVRGGVLAILVVAFLRLERLRRPDAAGAAWAGLLALALGMFLAPALDRTRPWWDYETWALSAGGSKSTTFAWDHEYGPLRWPRDGRELLRVKLKGPGTYWKADSLDRFDGTRWLHDDDVGDNGRQAPSVLIEGVDPALLNRWTTTLQVTVRNLRSDTFIVAGTSLGIDMPGRSEISTGRPGISRTTRQLKRGDAYRVQAYVPRPSPRQLREAGFGYAADVEPYQRLEVHGFGFADGTAGSGVPIVVPAFRAEPILRGSRLGGDQSAVSLLRRSDLKRTYALSRDLLDRSDTPYDYVQRVLRQLGRGFSYTESPPAESSTLEGFLFDSKTGFCQQYAGAMALLLRLGGIPARVAGGFSAGSLDRGSGEYVVRDIDAHSWVEAWFPGIGWVNFDPTPTSAPPRSQASPDLGGSAAIGDIRDIGTATADPRRGSAGSGPPWERIALIAIVAAALLALLVRAFMIRRHQEHVAHGPVAELERALRIAGGAVGPGTTLVVLESRFAASPPAAGYVRALRAQRYASNAAGPTPAQRRGLRRVLAHGGPLTHIRAWWALPPHWPRR
jgi:transglutaminase-like putative cysteine protease